MKKTLLMIIILMMPIFLYSCQEEEIADIYVTIYPVEFIVKEIVKDEFTVKSVYPMGQDIHEYELLTSDILNMKKGKAIFYIGLGLEPFLETAKNSTFKDNNLIALSDNVELVTTTDGHNHSDNNEYNYDEHIWLDPINMITMTNNTLDAIIRLNPDKEDFFRTNASELIDKLTILNQEYINALNNESIKSKVIMVDHDAYAYWTHRYGIERIKLRSNNETSDVTMPELEEKISKAKEYGIKYVIATKNEAKCGMFNQYITRLEAKEEELHHLGTVTKSEINGDEGTDFLDYFSIMRYNLKVLIKVLPKNI